MKTRINTLTVIHFVAMMILINIYTTNAQNACWNVFPPMIGYTGIQTQLPQEPLNIHGDTSCMRVVERFSYNNVLMPQYQSYLSLTTLPTLNAFTQVPTHGLGDFVISSMPEREGGNIIITTRDTNKSIVLATSMKTPAEEHERMKVFPHGRFDFNVGIWDWGLPKIMFNVDDDSNPAIRLYRQTGRDNSQFGESYPWWITCDIDHDGSLNFKSGPFTNIGSETVTTKVTFLENGNVGINNDNPQAKLQVTEGKVVFDGDANDGNLIPLGAGTRFMWIPELKAIRAGEVSGTQWNTIGDYSAAFGLDNIASMEGASAFGESNEARRLQSTAFGLSNIASNQGATAFGISNTASGGYGATAFGNSCNAEGSSSIAMGNGSTVHLGANDAIAMGNNSQSFGQYCVAIGDNSIAGKNFGTPDTHYVDAFANGYQAYAANNRTFAIGNQVLANGVNSTAMGNFVSTNYQNGSFIIGDHNGSSVTRTKSDNDDEIKLRFTGTVNDTGPTNYSFMLVTGYDALGNELGIHAFHKGYWWYSNSDSNLKKNIIPVDNQEILKRFRLVPVKTWQWKNDSAYSDTVKVYDSLSYTWMGPMAQDFYNQFPIGVHDSTLLSEGLMSSAMMASIQALANITDTLRGGIYNSWNKNGDSISSNNFLGTTNNQPLIIKTNSNERIRVADNQITFVSDGTSGDTIVNNAAVRFFTNSAMTSGIFLAGSESGYRVISDKNMKDDFRDIDNEKILESIERIPVSTWIYKNAPKGIRYIGPMSQDIYSEFQLGGTDSLSINSVIYDGINFAGIKALIGKTNDLKKQIDSAATKSELTSLRDSIKCYADACERITELEKKNQELQARLDSIESKLGGVAQKDNKPEQTIQGLNFEDIILSQNNPNPFAETTEINYYVPVKYQGNIQLILANESGSQIIQTAKINAGKPGQITISAKELHTGVYLYAIEFNGELVKAQKMMVIK